VGCEQGLRFEPLEDWCAELEWVVYPLNDNAATVKGNPNWKKDYVGMRHSSEWMIAPATNTSTLVHESHHDPQSDHTSE